MTYARPFSRAFLVLALGASLSLSGCDKDEKALSAEDDSNPYFHDAATHIQERNFPEAAKSYEAALRANPDVAQAHYELGILYGDKLNDPIAALYHFEQYLKARPSADNSPAAQERLNAAELNFAATVPNSPVQNAQAITALQTDKVTLQRDLESANQKSADLQAKLASAQKEIAAASPGMQAQAAGAPASGGLQDSTPPAAASASTAPVPTAPPAAVATAVAPAATPAIATNPAPAPAPSAEAPAQAYTIAAGDTLWRISKKFYPGNINAGIEKIKAANTDTLPPGKPLKIGTQIHIPQ